MATISEMILRQDIPRSKLKARGMILYP